MKTLLISAASLLAASSLMLAQSPTPLVVQAMSPAQPVNAPAVSTPDSSSANLKLLQEMKAANDAILGKQAAALQQLEDLEKAVEQLKIYTKRG